MAGRAAAFSMKRRKVRAPESRVPGNSRTPFGVIESATENIPPRVRESGSGARVKRWGKSPPLFRRRKRHGKPYPE